MACDFIYIGATPAEEDCEQAGGNRNQMVRECLAFIELIRAVHGPEPDGARLHIKTEYHEFGSYKEVVCDFDDTIPASLEYALKVEGYTPGKWIHEGKDYKPKQVVA